MEFYVLRHPVIKPSQVVLRITLSQIFALIAFVCFSQSDSSIYNVQKTNSNYKAILYSNDKVYAITESGRAVIWNLLALDTIPFTHDDTATHKFLCVAKDRMDAIYFGTDKGHIFKYNPVTGNCDLYKKLKYSVNHIFFNSANYPLVIVPYAVYDPITKRRWTEFDNHTDGLINKRKVLGLFSKRVYKYFQMPHYTFLDSQDRLWMTASFGEFGGDVQIFDTKNFRIVENKFDSLSPGLLHPKSVFESTDHNIFITSGLQHFSSSGDVYRISQNGAVSKVFHSSGPRILDRESKKVIDEGGVFIGLGAYNKQDSCIYFATSFGIRKIRVDQNTSKSAELVVNPKLQWGREPLAIGAAMNIKTMEFLPDGRLLFLTAMDGIGIYDGKKITLLH
jgi:outer membrane protein assembly factor BamB